MKSSIVVASVLEDSIEATAAAVARAPAGCALVEIRADRLRADELAGFVRGIGRDIIVTARLPAHGGSWDGGAEARADLLRCARTAGARYIDVEWDSPEAPWADGPDADGVILSHHGGPCDPASLRRVHRTLQASSAVRLKIVPHARSVAELAAVRELLQSGAGRDRRLTCFATGAAGTVSRILAPSWGAWGTYGSIAAGRETGAGQVTARDLLDVYRAPSIGPGTRRFGLVGRDLAGSPSPALHAAGYRRAGLDACYVSLEPLDLDDLEAAGDWLRLEGFGVTIPFKEDARRRCASVDAWAELSDAVNTVVCRHGGLHGANTDASAADRLIRSRLDPAGRAAVVVGAGGTGRTLVAVLTAAGADVTIVNRTASRADAIANRFGARRADWSDLPGLRAEIWVQATPLGRNGESVLPRAAAESGLVVDVAYGPRPTPAIAAARAAGIPNIDGATFLAEQAADQFEILTGVPHGGAELGDR